MSAYRYELWLEGHCLAKYKTLGPALLGALWRSRKRQQTIYVYRANAKGARCVAVVTVPVPVPKPAASH